MPTDVLLTIEERHIGRKKEAADLLAYLVLIPLIVCLGSLALGIKYPAFAAAVIATGQT